MRIGFGIDVRSIMAIENRFVIHEASANKFQSRAILDGDKARRGWSHSAGMRAPVLPLMDRDSTGRRNHPWNSQSRQTPRLDSPRDHPVWLRSTLPALALTERLA